MVEHVPDRLGQQISEDFITRIDASREDTVGVCH